MFWVYISASLANVFTISVQGPRPQFLLCMALCLLGAWRHR
jgi:hypothetical protein